MSRTRILQGFLLLSGLAMIANALWMLGHALHWFYHVPAAMPDTGHPNGHLIRDVGLAYFIFGAGLIWSAGRLAQARPVVVLAGAFMAGHALGHALEIFVGLLPPSHWLTDLPLVLLPGMVFAALLLPSVWRWVTRQ